MRKHRFGFVLALGSLLIAFTACSFNLTTANIKSLKISKDEDGKNEASTFGPGERVYAIADIANNPGKVKVKFRVLYDDVEGKDAGSSVAGAEKTLDIEGSRPAIFWITLPRNDFADGAYKAEVTMFADNDQQKGQKTATFKVEGFKSENQKHEEDNNSEDAGRKDNGTLEDAAARESSEDETRLYKGAWFEVKYPSTFRVRPSLRSSSARGYDSVFFTSPDQFVEFYVFSPQWNGEPSDIELKPESEVQESLDRERKGNVTIRRMTIKAKDDSYYRSFEDTEDSTTNTRKVFGIKYRNQEAYNRFRQSYLAFKQSLTQFAD